MALQHLRSGTANKRPIPTAMSAGQIAINTNEASPGLFFKDSNGDLVKVGPVHIGTSAPNSSPASTAATALVTGTIYQILTVGTTDFTAVGASANTIGVIFTATGAGTGTGTVSGQQGVEKGEQWLDTTGGNYVLKIYDGTAWRSEAGEFVNVTGDTMTGALLLDNAASASAPDLSFDGDPNTGIYSPGADQFAIATAGSDRLYVDSSGNVMIGTTSSGKKLAVVSSAWGQAEIVGPSGSELYFASAVNGASDGIISYNHTSDSMNFYTTGSNRLTIDSSGKVGIGLTAPQTGLHLSDGSSLAAPQNTGAGRLTIQNSSSADIQLMSANTGYNHIFFGDQDDANVGVINYVHNGGTNAMTFATNAEERMRIDSSGNLLVGLTSAVGISGTPADLNSTEIGRGYINISRDDTSAADHIQFGKNGSVASSIGTSTTDSLTFKTGTTERLRIDSNGRLLLGTTTEGYATLADKLTIANAGHCGMTIRSGSSHNGSIYFSDATSGADEYDGYIEYQHTGRSLLIGTAQGTRVTINSSGHVGIGKSPVDTNGYSRALDLTGAAGAAIYLRTNAPSNSTDYGVCGYYGSDMYVGNYASGPLRFLSNSTERMRVASSGNIGIGTTSPYAILGGRSLGIANSGGHVELNFLGSTTSYQGIYFGKGTGATDRIKGYIEYKQDNNFMRFATDGVERVRINSAGNVNIGTTVDGYSNYADKLTIADSSHCGMTIRSGNTSQGNIYFADATSGTAEYAGIIQYRHDDDAMAFGVGNGIERLRINSAGNVGINTTVPGVDLEVGGNNDNVAAICVRYSTVPAYLTNSFNGTSGLTTLSNNLRNTSDGSTSWSSFTNAGYTAAAIQLTSSQSAAELRFFTSGTANAVPSERMRIDGNGDAHIGKTAFTGHDTNGHTFNNSGWAHHSSAAGVSTLYLNRSSSTSSTEGNIVEFYLGGTYEGNIYINSSGIYFNSVSDYRLKENVIDITDGITRLKQLSPRRFNFIKNTDVTVDGFIAHEVQTVVPEAVCGEKDGEEMQGMDHARLIPLLTAALQEAIAKIETLETKVAQLEAG